MGPQFNSCRWLDPFNLNGEGWERHPLAESGNSSSWSTKYSLALCVCQNTEQSLQQLLCIWRPEWTQITEMISSLHHFLDHMQTGVFSILKHTVSVPLCVFCVVSRSCHQKAQTGDAGLICWGCVMKEIITGDRGGLCVCTELCVPSSVCVSAEVYGWALCAFSVCQHSFVLIYRVIMIYCSIATCWLLWLKAVYWATVSSSNVFNLWVAEAEMSHTRSITFKWY